MNRKDAIDMLKGCIEDYLKQRGLPADGKTLFRCLSPGHADHHPSMCYYKEGKMVRCFGCHARYDIFDLIGMDYALRDFNDQLAKAAEIFGVEIDSGNPVKQVAVKADVVRAKTKKVENIVDPVKKDGREVSLVADENNSGIFSISENIKPDVFEKNIAFIKSSTRNTEKAAAYLETRGISGELACKFNIGYGMYRDYRSNTVWNAIVIPNPDGPVAAVRNVDSNADKNNRYRKLNGTGIWNVNALKTGAGLGMRVVVTEGELDALSVISCGGLAIALSSTTNFSRVVPVLRQMFGPDPAKAPELVLALDNDINGKKTTDDLSAQLRQGNYKFIVLNLYGTYKDANEALVQDGAYFKDIVLASRTAADWDLYNYKLKYCDEKYIPKFLSEILANDGKDTVSTGFPRLDAVLEGGLHPDLYVLGAIPSLGKTTLILEMAYNIAKSGRDVFYFSLEMSRSEVIAKHVSRLTYARAMEAGLNSLAAKTSTGIMLGSRYKFYTPEEIDLIKGSIADYARVSCHIHTFEGVGSFGVQEIAKIVDEHISKTHQLPVLFIDYLQILAPYDEKASDKVNMDKAVVELKRLSRDKKIPVVVVSSFNRENYSVSVSFKAFKESGIIESTASVCIGLQLKGVGTTGFDVDVAKSKKPREIELVVLKNRFGETGVKILYFYHQLFNKFDEAATNDDYYQDGTLITMKPTISAKLKPLRKLK